MYDVPLAGAGTGSVESLPSYLQRCAHHHCVPMCKFLDYLSTNAPEPSTSRSAHTVKRNGLLTSGQQTYRYLNAIYQLTGKNLIHSTFSVVQHITTNPKREIARSTRWCPECFQDMKRIGSERYIKLIWHLADIKHCPLHKTPLLEACPRCRRKQQTLWVKGPLDICHSCEHNLADRYNRQLGRPQPSWFNQGGDMIKLILDVTHNASILDNNIFRGNPQEDISIHLDEIVKPFRSGLEKSLRDFSTYFTDPYFFQAYRHLWKNRESRNQIWGEKTITLRTIRILAHFSRVSIFDVLTGKMQNIASSSFPELDNYLPKELTSIERRKTHNHDLNRKRILELASLDPPPSLKEIARQTGLSLGYINYQFPILKKMIVERHSQKRDEICRIKNAQAMSCAMNYFFDEKYANHPKSRKQALATLIDETKLTKLYLKPAIKIAYDQYQQKTFNRI
jgi:hypothetical protein